MESKAVSLASDPDQFPTEKAFDSWPEESDYELEITTTPASLTNDRRSFLGVLSGLIGAAIATFLGITLGRFSISPALAAANVSEWVEVVPLTTLPEDKPTNYKVMVSQNAGWGRFTSEQSVWITRTRDQLTVFSSVCPHLGCTISETPNGFGCVCHNSAWTRNGETSGGPTPRGMDRLEQKVEDGILKVRYQTFKQGVAEKIAAS